MDVATNLKNIQQNIQEACNNSNRDPNDINIIGVTKYVTIERTKEAIEAGLTDLGENRMEGFLEKYTSINEEVNWHFIGTLQSRKVKEVIDKVDYIHSLDRLSLAKEIDKRANKPINCFIQLNVSGEESKHGLAPAELSSFLTNLEKYKNVRVVGLMTMAPHTDNHDEIRNVFKNLAALRDEVQSKKLAYAPCEFLSMGMSNDYEIAIEEGATHIRIGSKLVGDNE
ncbi:YggS family pyridoxal phosphate-dependent enzyme [Ornithinibacillus halophilus]|uniref:Pyridoxal phosphate homeostasis protein n=1 Tax=Ornithinibacillus halophilus TaxID=930117 RepID=A0A1M5C565_9BACI|nr:YggS family pyridoxal phosphate-dependent enzyme [Ornithinibacillus halophilus]SHF49747.1 hypothetical protein SAMN05216225_100164 [Ornithinibacillus halophilus]